MYQVLYTPETGAIVEFRNTEEFAYAEPGEGQTLLELSEAQYSRREEWNSVVEGKMSKKQPGEPIVPEPSDEVLRARVANLQADALRLAAERIAPLQDAVDLDEATAAETAKLKAWKQYRVAVNRVAAQPGYPGAVVWPTVPA